MKWNERIKRVLAHKGAMHRGSVYKPHKFVMRCGNYGDSTHML